MELKELKDKLSDLEDTSEVRIKDGCLIVGQNIVYDSQLER